MVLMEKSGCVVSSLNGVWSEAPAKIEFSGFLAIKYNICHLVTLVAIILIVFLIHELIN